MGQPILFVQRRPGYLGKSFHLLKFRTMKTVPSTQPPRLEDDESRLTRLGSFLRSTSLDELPSLLNILSGSISFVGPRPLLMEYLSSYTAEQMSRHDVRPGLTGLAQVSGRNLLTLDQKVSLDLLYIRHRSFFLDLKILFLTIFCLFRRSDSCAVRTKIPFS